MQGKPISQTRVVMTHQMLPHDATSAGNVHGGVVMKHIDVAAAVVAMRHTRTNVVTAGVDRLDFLAPVYVGELVHLKASLNHVGTSSMEVGVRAEAENLLTGEVRHTISAYLTFVALDPDGKPIPAPPLILETEDDRRRNREAERRRETRKALRRSESPARRTS